MHGISVLLEMLTLTFHNYYPGTSLRNAYQPIMYDHSGHL